MMVQLCKVVLQVGMDNGGWDVAALLWPMPDPLGSEEWAGDLEEMQAAYRWRKAMTELLGMSKARLVEVVSGEGEDDKGGETRRGRRGGGKGKAKAKPQHNVAMNGARRTPACRPSRMRGRWELRAF